ncbi:hypothetical protein TU94_03800 [Streptomyces cyaneogriseus subsp. noncyanogenus]|uniref:Uncharacterized protein n=1 Tax=Streptomyces cyaneogriseus subsp. noncyanogenus TaxID=477245 RepID=A0A0C5FXZ2_9ACTN|nr:hypothetical protein TU94_03800 [Streptomyces cyaneogriseus subsp. noncyanogenus]
MRGEGVCDHQEAPAIVARVLAGRADLALSQLEAASFVPGRLHLVQVGSAAGADLKSRPPSPEWPGKALRRLPDTKPVSFMRSG